MRDYQMPREVAHQLAVGLYRDIAAFIKAADPEDYLKFMAAYLNRQAAQPPTSAKRSYSRKSRTPR